MSGAGDRQDLASLVADLVRTLEDLEEEFEPGSRRGFPRPPTPGEMIRFTSDVAIPAAILVLRTNLEALKLFQRALRMADGRHPTSGSDPSRVRERTAQVTRATLDRLDDAFNDLQSSIEGTPQDEAARTLLEEARELRTRIDAALEVDAGDQTHEGSKLYSQNSYDSTDDEEPQEESDVGVDIDAEMKSLKDEYGDDSTDSNGGG